MSDEKIVERDFVKKEEQGRWPIKLVEYDMHACPHHVGIINERARTLTCDSCEVALDPIEFIARLAKTDRAVHWERQRLEELRAERVTHAIGHTMRADGSDSGTRCGTSGDTFHVTRKRMWVSCKRCKTKLGIDSGLGSDELI
jgi:hypothetical protein